MAFSDVFDISWVTFCKDDKVFNGFYVLRLGYWTSWTLKGWLGYWTRQGQVDVTLVLKDMDPSGAMQHGKTQQRREGND